MVLIHLLINNKDLLGQISEWLLKENLSVSVEVDYTREHFILEKIAEEEDVEDSPADYDAEIAKIAIQRNDSPRRVRARLEREGQMDSLRNMIIEDKVIGLIEENAKFKATDYKPDDASDTTAINFFVAGSPDNIPEAKYDPAEAGALPKTVERD